MNLGIGLSVSTTYQSIPVVGLDPDAAIAALFSSGEEGAWYDPSDLSTVWQDAAGTTPATVGDPVGRIDDKSGNGNHATQSTSTARPTLQLDGSSYYLDFDGVDDWIECTYPSAIAQPNSTAMAFKYDSLSAGNNKFILDCPTTGFRQRWFDNASNFQISAGTTASFASASTSDRVVSALFDGASSEVKIDGGAASVVNLGTEGQSGVTLATAYTHQAQYCPDARIYGIVTVDRALTTAEREAVESYLATKSGVTLP